MSLLRLHFLGTPHFEHDAGPVELSSAKWVALLAYLALAREPQPRERLFALLWGGSSEEAARKNLRNALWGLGRSLGDHVIRSDDQRIALSDDVWIDTREFENANASGRAQEAIDLYRGELLADLTLQDSPDFEIWLTGEREHFTREYLRLLERIAGEATAVSDWPRVVELAGRALEADNLLEPMYRAQMDAYARLGERTRALRQYDTLRETLVRELDVEPLPETQALRERIAQGELAPALAVPPASGRRSPSGPGTTPFVGRTSERRALDVECERARSGHARVALITGEVGIGKSRLWQEWSRGLDAMTLAARCLEATEAIPFAPLAELLRDRAILSRLLSPSSSLPRLWLAELARLLPEIRAQVPDLALPAPLPPEEERRRILEAFTQCILALETSMLVLFVDDAHWADHATLDWLDYMVHRLERERLLLVIAYRPEDAPARLVQLVARWSREGLSRRIPLARLSEQESAELAAAFEASRSPADLHTQSGGNPFFLIELARARPGEVPQVLTELVRTRLDRLPATAQQVLQAAAVLEPDFSFSVLRRTSGRDEEETLDALDALLEAGVLIEVEREYRFGHPLVAAIVREGLSGARRVFMHRRAAEALSATQADRLDAVAGQVMEHYAEAGDRAAAAYFAEIAARHAVALAAPDEAATFYRRALEFEPTPARHMGLGRVLLSQVDLGPARAEFETALEGFRAQGDRRGAARAAMNIAETLFPSARFAEAQEWMERSLTLVEAEDDVEARVLLLLLRGSSELNAGAPGLDAEKNLREAAETAAAHDLLDVGARASFMLGNLLAERGDLVPALEAYRRTIELAHRDGNDFQEVLGHNNLAYHALLLGDLKTAHQQIKAGLELAEAHALRLPLQHLYSTRGEIALAEKEWDEAEEWFARGLVEAERNGNRREQANYQANRGLAAQGRGDLDGAVVLLESARETASDLTEPHLQTRLDLYLAQLYLERGERTAGREALARAHKRLKGSERHALQDWADDLAARLREPNAVRGRARK